MTTFSSKMKLIITLSVLFHTITLSIVPGTDTVSQYLQQMSEQLLQASTYDTITTTTTTTTTTTSTTSTTTAPVEEYVAPEEQGEEEEPVSEEEEEEEEEESEYGPQESTGPPVWKPVEGPYKLGNLITCLEQNDEDPYGYKEKLTYGNWDSETCAEYPELCDKYMDCELDPEFCGTGDVCDHDDPLVRDVDGNRLIRDSCKMQTLFLPIVDPIKSWAWKCARHEICPVKNESAFYYDQYGNKLPAGTMGCKLSPKRAICCCQYDYCQKEDIYAQYAAFGREESYPPDLQKLVNLDPGNTYVEYDGFPDWVVLPDWDCIRAGECPYPTMPPQINTTTAATTATISQESSSTIYDVENTGVYELISGKSEHIFMEQHDIGDSGMNKGNNGIVSMEDLILIFGFFIIAILCCGIGVFIGTKMNNGDGVSGGMKINNQFVSEDV
eukprot:232232_1